MNTLGWASLIAFSPLIAFMVIWAVAYVMEMAQEEVGRILLIGILLTMSTGAGVIFAIGSIVTGISS